MTEVNTFSCVVQDDGVEEFWLVAPLQYYYPTYPSDGWIFFRSLGELLASNHTVTVVQDNVVSTSLLDLLDPSYPLGRVLFSRSPKVLGPHALFATEVTHPSLLTINCVGGKLCNIL